MARAFTENDPRNIFPWTEHRVSLRPEQFSSTQIPLTAPRLLNLLEGATFRFRNHLPNKEQTSKRKRAVDRKCSPEVQNLDQAEECKGDQKCARPEG